MPWVTHILLSSSLSCPCLPSYVPAVSCRWPRVSTAESHLGCSFRKPWGWSKKKKTQVWASCSSVNVTCFVDWIYFCSDLCKSHLLRAPSETQGTNLEPDGVFGPSLDWQPLLMVPRTQGCWDPVLPPVRTDFFPKMSLCILNVQLTLLEQETPSLAD